VNKEKTALHIILISKLKIVYHKMKIHGRCTYVNTKVYF